jgi:hypothetical protein
MLRSSLISSLRRVDANLIFENHTSIRFSHADFLVQSASVLDYICRKRLCMSVGRACFDADAFSKESNIKRTPNSHLLDSTARLGRFIQDGLNLLPSMATLAFVSRPISRQSSTKRAHTLRIARPLSLRKSAIVL